MDAKYEADTKIADSARMYQMQKANFDMEVNARVRLTSLLVLACVCCVFLLHSAALSTKEESGPKHSCTLF